jgi:hypothetical protein
MARKAISADVEASVILKGARRCPICFYLHRDLAVKKGQVAHLDKDSSNPSEDNLAYMCFDHHDEYDSTTRQSKNFTLHEVKEARKRLFEAIAAEKHIPEGSRSQTSLWAVRYPGGLADVALFSDVGAERFAIAEGIVIVGSESKSASIRVNLFVQYGITQLGAKPTSMSPEKWDYLLNSYGLRKESLLSFPLNLPAGCSVEGHIAFPVPYDGLGKGTGGDVPEERRYMLEFEDLISGEKRSVNVTAVFAPDLENHRRISPTDLTLPIPIAIRSAGWEHFNRQKTIDDGGQSLYEEVIPDAVVSCQVPAPCSMLDVVKAIAEHSSVPFPIDTISDQLLKPVLPRGKTLFGNTGEYIDQLLGNYSDLQWWFTAKGLTIRRCS